MATWPTLADLCADSCFVRSLAVAAQAIFVDRSNPESRQDCEVKSCLVRNVSGAAAFPDSSVVPDDLPSLRRRSCKEAIQARVSESWHGPPMMIFPQDGIEIQSLSASA